MTDTTVTTGPRGTMQLFGHESAEKTFLESWNSGRMPHAWLITGRHGIGKATLAYRVARFVLSQRMGQGGGLFGEEAMPADSLDTDPTHPVCRQITASGHPDMLTIERSINPSTKKLRGEIVVDDVKRLSSFLSLTTSAGEWRVVIVDAADEMNRNAANALLKGLEEPPSSTLFLLVSHAPGRLLPTIRSRCRTLNLSPLPDATVIDLLAHHAPDLPAADASALAGLAQGSIGEALTLADAGGLELYRDMVGLFAQLGRLDIKAVHGLGAKLGRPGAEDGFRMLARLVDRWLAGMLLAGARGNSPREIIEGEGETARRLWARGGLANWLEVWEKVTRLFSQADRANLDRKQVVISAFLMLEAAARG
ncbi:MAG: DNA polymerase III subunit delta' [Alphaproteobacteria bacterium]|nr:DNA polymerase III subunit delta' [Alphaproteobacteria bacterium]